jgi:pyruvate dehydrogenase (quinone)
LGFRGIYCDSGAAIGGAWDEALSHTDRPVLLEVKVDPEIPPLPPHIRFDQAMHMMSSIWKGDPEAWGIMLKSAKGKGIEFLKRGTS